MIDTSDIDVSGLIDMHIHTAPDVRPRVVDDVEAARQAAAAGMRAIVFKPHVTCTADRATIAERMVPEVRVFGGVTLNDAVGGLNPVAVEAALRLDARFVWMPTISAQNHVVRYDGGSPSGISLLTDDEQLQPVLFDIFDLVKQHDAVLGTSHVSVREIVALVRAARAVGVRQVVVTHPEVPWVDMSVGVQKELRDLGATFERCYVSAMNGVPLGRIVSDIRQVGVESTVLATDFGKTPLPPPVEGMRAYVAALLAEGFGERDIKLMAGENPARLLRLD